VAAGADDLPDARVLAPGVVRSPGTAAAGDGRDAGVDVVGVGVLADGAVLVLARPPAAAAGPLAERGDLVAGAAAGREPAVAGGGRGARRLTAESGSAERPTCWVTTWLVAQVMPAVDAIPSSAPSVQRTVVRFIAVKLAPRRLSEGKAATPRRRLTGTP
jgi:hypothetical protein